MRVAIGADHRGYELKEQLIGSLKRQGHAVTDLGTHSIDPVDYPDYAAAVADAVASGRADRGIVVCGSGAGAAIAANKIRGIRAVQCSDTYTAAQSVEHDDANVIAIGALVVGDAVADELATHFLDAEFTGEERHLRRLEKVKALEDRYQAAE
ncbi:MAG: ribose 5-phosphate isomerase B [Acidimicrobiia bacterium]|nr:ribose 5-phosphate isomerase B [Acidimicrobiia bacterium]